MTTYAAPPGSLATVDAPKPKPEGGPVIGWTQENITGHAQFCAADHGGYWSLHGVAELSTGGSRSSP